MLVRTCAAHGQCLTLDAHFCAVGKGGDAGHADRELTPKLRLCRRLIEDILRRLAVLPRFRTFVRMLEFDVGQMVRAALTPCCCAALQQLTRAREGGS